MIERKFANDVIHITDYLYIDERTVYRFSNGYRRFLSTICAHLFQRDEEFFRETRKV